MCPPLSCCYLRSPGHLPTLLYYLGRLLLAGPDELTPAQAQRLPARLDALWHACYQLYRRPGHSLALLEQLLPALLEQPCCASTLRQRIPLAEALHRSLRGRRHWARRAAGLRLRATAAPKSLAGHPA